MGNALELESRKMIYDFIRSRPGTYMREMERELGMGVGMLTYHLRVLTEAGIIRVEKEGNHLRYFRSDDLHLEDRRTLSYLRDGPSRVILVYILDNGSVSVSQLKALTGMSSSTIYYHLKKLSSVGLVAISKGESITASFLDPDRMINMLLLVKEDIEKDPAEALTSAWDRLKRLRPLT